MPYLIHGVFWLIILYLHPKVIDDSRFIPASRTETDAIFLNSSQTQMDDLIVIW